MNNTVHELFINNWYVQGTYKLRTSRSLVPWVPRGPFSEGSRKFEEVGEGWRRLEKVGGSSRKFEKGG